MLLESDMKMQTLLANFRQLVEGDAQIMLDDFVFWRIMAESGFTQQEGSLPLLPLTDIEDYMVSEYPYESPDLQNDSVDCTEDQRVFTVLDTPDRSRLCVDDLARLPDLFASLGSKGHGFHDMDDFKMQTWTRRPPYLWNDKEVGDWLYCTAGIYDIDDSLRGEAFQNVSGKDLCEMKVEDFNVLGENWSIIYREFVLLRSKYPAEAQGSGEDYHRDCSTIPPCDFHTTHTDTTEDNKRFQIPQADIHVSVAAPSTDQLPVKRGRGRPRKYPRPVTDGRVIKVPKPRGRKKGQRSRGHHLWEFLRDLLHDANQNPRIIQWEDQQNGVFRIIDSGKVAKLWGEKKDNKKMTYEKLSRAIRFCQNESVGYFSKLPEYAEYPKKLCFMFGPRTSGWQ